MAINLICPNSDTKQNIHLLMIMCLIVMKIMAKIVFKIIYYL